MNNNVLPEETNIYIINKRINNNSHNHVFVLKVIQMYNKNNTINAESVFECKDCKKIFIVKGNKERFENNYPQYKIGYEKKEKKAQSKNEPVKKVMTNKNKKSEIKENTKVKKKKMKKSQQIINERQKLEERIAKQKLEKELIKNNPVEKKKQIILKAVKNNDIRVFNEEHEHKPINATYKFGNESIKLLYCEKCSMLFCYTNEYYEYIKMGIPRKKFNVLEHVDVSMFSKKESDEIKQEMPIKKEKTKQLKSIEHTKINDTIQKRTLFVKTDNRRCIFENHPVVSVNVKIDLLNNEGEKISKTIPAFSCETCGITYIYDSQFEQLVRKGQPLCLIVDQTIYSKIATGKRFFLGTDSILTLYGYNVNQNEDLKQKQRQNILKTLIDTKIIRKDVAISHLRWLIRQRESRKNHKKAISRWQEDIDFLINYNVNRDVTYSIDTIINKSRTRF